MSEYKCLGNQEFALNSLKIVPIRDSDKFKILNWRNDQISILRQKREISQKEQEDYFQNVIKNQYAQEQPNQILFSYLDNSDLIGYGGLVHIDWDNRNAEISFLLDSNLNTNKSLFLEYFSSFIDLIKSVAFNELTFIKLHTTVYDIKERLYYIETLNDKGFIKEANLKNHLISAGRLCDMHIYSLFNSKLENRSIS